MNIYNCNAYNYRVAQSSIGCLEFVFNDGTSKKYCADNIAFVAKTLHGGAGEENPNTNCCIPTRIANTRGDRIGNSFPRPHAEIAFLQEIFGVGDCAALNMAMNINTMGNKFVSVGREIAAGNLLNAIYIYIRNSSQRPCCLNGRYDPLNCGTQSYGVPCDQYITDLVQALRQAGYLAIVEVRSPHETDPSGWKIYN